MINTFLIITSIAKPDHPVLKQFASEASEHEIPFILIGDTKSPEDFNLEGCDFYSIKHQLSLNFELSGKLPTKHYARKNLGYLIAISKGAEVIIETDDDNIPSVEFWSERNKRVDAHLLIEKGWVNIYKYFVGKQVWPRGFPLEHIQDELPKLKSPVSVECPIQQGLADGNPDVDAIYRLIMPLPCDFGRGENIALGTGSICPFNSQNTTWFKEAFPLLYLPSYCNFRMTDIWRSIVAQRVAWTCGWSVLFHHSTVWQQRNDHNLMKDFQDEISGYINNVQIARSLSELNLKMGIVNMTENMHLCYEKLIQDGFFPKKELELLSLWLNDICELIQH